MSPRRRIGRLSRRRRGGSPTTGSPTRCRQLCPPPTSRSPSVRGADFWCASTASPRRGPTLTAPPWSGSPSLRVLAGVSLERKVHRVRPATMALPVVPLAGVLGHGPFHAAAVLQGRRIFPGCTARTVIGRVPPIPLENFGPVADLIAVVRDAAHGAEQLSLAGAGHRAQPRVELREGQIIGLVVRRNGTGHKRE